MVSAMVIREARKRAGLSQAELAARLGRPQSSVARWEAGLRAPNLETVREVARACGLELTLGLPRADDSYDWLIDRQLELGPGERLRTMLRGVTFDPVAVLRSLHDRGVAHLLVGEVAAVLQGCPITLDRRVLAITPHPEHAAAAADALRALGADAHETQDEFHGLHSLDLWTLPDQTSVELVRTPAGTHGFFDLRRDRQLLELGADLPMVSAASVADLARIAEASPRPVDRAWRTALRRLAERLEVRGPERPPLESDAHVGERH